MIRRLTISVLLMLTLTTCEKDHMLDCFKNKGDDVTDYRDATPFTNINLTDNVDLLIRTDTVSYIKVTAGDNLIDGIITELSGNTLYIRNENRCNWMRSFSNTYTVEVGMDKLVSIYYDGSGDITCLDTIRSDDFTFDCFGGSGSIRFLFNSNKTHLNNHIGRTDMHAAGFCIESQIYINDVGTGDFENMIAENCYIRSSTTGECRVNVTNSFGYEILYTGNIYYSGNPVIYAEMNEGSGSLIHY